MSEQENIPAIPTQPTQQKPKRKVNAGYSRRSWEYATAGKKDVLKIPRKNVTIEIPVQLISRIKYYARWKFRMNQTLTYEQVLTLGLMALDAEKQLGANYIGLLLGPGKPKEKEPEA